LRLLHVLPSANPDTGGPLEGVKQRGLHLQRLGHTVELVTLDDPNQSFVKQFPLAVHALGPSRAPYHYSRRLVPWLRRHAREFDAVVINGIWQYHSFGAWRALRRARTPYFVFTHGMLDPWFKREYPLKHLKKWLYWPWSDYRVLRDARAVLFTSEEERLAARESFWLYRAKEHVIAYGTTAPPENAADLSGQFLAAHPQLKNRRVLLFLGRIHVKKGCDLLIQAFAAASGAEPALQLVMAGPDNTGWAEELKRLAQQLGISDRVTWVGMLQGGMKWGAFYCADAFILPSHQENFGIAVAEALGCGLPVLISDKVNIWREVLSHGAGVVAPDTREGTLQLLRTWLAMTPTQRLAMGKNARGLYEKKFTVSAMATELLDLVRRETGQSKPAQDDLCRQTR
jgi:glycosyltransferase involved in cell wall biosynthesis